MAITVQTRRITRPMSRVMAAIRAGERWLASAETVQALLDAGLASYDDAGVWRLTPTGEAVMDAR